MLTGDNPSSSIAYNLTANATGGAGGTARFRAPRPGGDATATTNATSATANGSVSASAAATGGDAGVAIAGHAGLGRKWNRVLHCGGERP